MNTFIGEYMKIYVNAFTGQRATTKNGMKRWDFPPFYQGDWMESDTKWKAKKHTYVVMIKKKE